VLQHSLVLRYPVELIVTVKEHPEYGRLLDAMKLAAARAHPWSGTIYRSAPPKWSAGRDMLTGFGSMKSGARFNAPGSFAAVYGSTTPELAMIESLAYQRRAGLPVERALPLVFKAVSVEVERLLDLTDAAVLGELSVTADELRTEAWWLARARGEESLTQAVGRAAHACGVQALLVAPAHALTHGHNVIGLPDHIDPPSRLKVLRRPAK
jgi:RES domain-containing protein